ncbi:hypothetical protein G2W53_013241 [Senna tora]|uniref:Uncharacterized protein n=1 Tax=Senna tora TaxID=362788 RepID=A0A834TY45_9FABA|nr:hypothetical protein G2W53_013241 [Senna tora]
MVFQSNRSQKVHRSHVGVQIRLHTRNSRCSSCGSRRGGAAEERQEAGVAWLLIVQKQILRDPERTVRANDGQSNHQSRNQERSNVREENNEHRPHHQNAQNFAIREVDTEVGEVLTDPRICFGERIGAGHCGPVDEFRPWAALGESLSNRGGEACDERAKSGCSNGRLRLGTIDAAVGLGIGDRECRRRGHWWRVILRPPREVLQSKEVLRRNTRTRRGMISDSLRVPKEAEM